MIPLYHPTNQWNGVSRTCPVDGHSGLWFERFFDQYSSDWSVGDTGKRDFLRAFQGRHGDSDLLKRHGDRLARLVEGLEGSYFAMRSSWHFATGLGNPHPVENGLTWHPVLGTPYLPGSAVKGLVCAWLELHDYDADVRKRLFGSDDKALEPGPEPVAGELIFFDALPLEPVSLVLDVMTPHMGKWYEQGGSPTDADAIPADWHAPVPVLFLAAREIVLQFAIAPRHAGAEPLVELARQALGAALEALGAGAKTAVGYGAFVEDQRSVEMQQARREEREQARRERAEQQAFDALDDHQRLLVELRREADMPANQNPSSGADFLRRIADALRQAEDWPEGERQELGRFARGFLKQYGSKAKRKELGPLIRRLLGEA